MKTVLCMCAKGENKLANSRASRLQKMFDRFTPNSKLETISIEEHNKIKQALTEANVKVDSLRALNEALTAENATLREGLQL